MTCRIREISVTSWHVLRSPHACKWRNFAGNTIHTVSTDLAFTHSWSIHTAAVLQGIASEFDATCSLSVHSRFKHPLQSCAPPRHSLTLPVVPPGRCFPVIMVSKHNRTSCSSHLNVTYQRAVVCTVGCILLKMIKQTPIASTCVCAHNHTHTRIYH